MLKRMTAMTAAMLIAAAGATAQDKQPEKKVAPKQAQPAEVTLKVGDKAPALSVEEWIKGDKVNGFEAGKVYVVEFWATWCPPCRESIPKLTHLQKEFKDKGVTVLGIASSERKVGTEDKRLEVLKKFVTEKGDEMKYVIAYDEDRSMSKAWMQAADQKGIPCAFVVNKEGKIAFIGNPLSQHDQLVDAVKKSLGGAKASIDSQPVITLAGYQPEKTDAKAAQDKPKAKAQPAAEPDTTLFVGDKAPEITVSKWVKGEPVTGFEKGKTYVVEYWATWCGPCKESIPHLTELQKDNKDVRFIGVSVWESDQKAVEPFVKDMGEKMDYTVAMDDIPAAGDDEKPGRNASMNGKMAKNWMAAAGQHGIPTAFIVNGEGKIAWIGHPMSMEEPLAKITSGKWDLAKEAADYRQKAEVASKLKPLQKKFQTAMQTGDTDGALAAMDEIVKLDPKSAPMMAPRKFLILLNEKKDFDKAFTYGNEIVDGVIKNDAQALNQVAWTLVDPDNAPDKTDLKLAMKAAKRAYEVTEGKDAAITDTLAKVYYDTGDLTKALEYQEKAAKMSEGTQFEDEIKGRLEQFKEAVKKKGG